MTDSPPPSTPRCLVITDGRRGIENQAMGLAEAMSRITPLTLINHHTSQSGLFAKASPAMQFSLKSSLTDYGLADSAPQIAIGCGRQAIAPLRALKKAYNDDIFTIYIQNPRTSLSYFDLVITPEHDGISGANVEPMIGSPNRVTKAMIVGETLSFGARLQTLPMPRITALIGGPSKLRALSRQTHASHIEQLRALLEQNYSLLITPSRRTPDWALTDYKLLASDYDAVWLYEGGDPNPYFAFLGGAEAILVTEESTNMLTEACATGKPVYRLAMDGDPGKFEQLYAALSERCGVTAFDGSLSSPDYKPLDETARIAACAWAHIDRRTATIN